MTLLEINRGLLLVTGLVLRYCEKTNAKVQRCKDAKKNLGRVWKNLIIVLRDVDTALKSLCHIAPYRAKLSPEC